MMITFEPLPREFFARDAAPARITRFREKVALLRESGLDHLLVLPFDRRMADVPARSVIEDFLVRQLAVRYVVVGDDFRFGRGGEGAYPLVKAAGDRLGFGVSHMGTLKSEDGRVSSTRIRELLAAGDLAAAERLLGHPYFLCGRVVHGRRLGRTIGAPTANIRLPRFRVPVAGVFVVEAVLDGRTCPGLANVGVRPTVGGREPLLEVHLLDFDGDVYGRRLKVTFRHRVRAERAFPSLDALRAQIVDDIASARAYLATAA
jgi:riboflavin kinase/FMN adenylyltransferase